MVVCYTGLGILLISLLWILSDFWEWTVPEGIGERINDLKKKWYLSQIIVRFVNNNSIPEQEQFAYSLRQILPKIERELGAPVHVEVEMGRQDIALSEEEMRYLTCLSRSFAEFTWHRNDRVGYETE